jgi:hypothetical protein
MTEFLMIMMVLGYMIISIGFGVLEYLMDRKRKNRRRMDLSLLNLVEKGQ